MVGLESLIAENLAAADDDALRVAVIEPAAEIVIADGKHQLVIPRQFDGADHALAWRLAGREIALKPGISPHLDLAFIPDKGRINLSELTDGDRQLGGKIDPYAFLRGDLHILILPESLG